MQDMTVGKTPKRYFTPEQKFQIIQDIGTYPVIKDGLARHAISYTTYAKWKRQLDVGIKASLRNTKPIKPASERDLEIANRRLMEIVLNLSHQVCELKKTFSLPH